MRKRRVAKWVGTVIFVVLLGIACHSFWYHWAWWTPHGGVVLFGGDVSLYPITGTDDSLTTVFRLDDGYPLGTRLSRTLRFPRAVSHSGGVTICYILPTWFPLLIVAMPTAFLWSSDRRRHPPNHCQASGYNLTGNVSGTCPECGAPIRQEGDAT